jgi:hypothetical protein
MLMIIGVIAIRRSRRRAADRTAAGGGSSAGGPRSGPGGGGGPGGGPDRGPGPRAGAGMPGHGMDDDDFEAFPPPKARGDRDQRGAVYGGPAGRGDARGGPTAGRGDVRGDPGRDGPGRGADPRSGVIEAPSSAGPASPMDPPTAGGMYRPPGRSGGLPGRSGGAVYGARRDDQAERPGRRGSDYPPEYPEPYRDEHRGRRR